MLQESQFTQMSSQGSNNASKYTSLMAQQKSMNLKYGPKKAKIIYLGAVGLRFQHHEDYCRLSSTRILGDES